MDKIVQGNTSNIVFLKSTDDSMLDTLQKMSGTTHVVRISGASLTSNKSKIIHQMNDDQTINYQVNEEPVIKYNDMAFIGERNSIVFRAGDPPIWNKNQLILPMSWRLFKNTIVHYGHDYSLQTIPTLSSALDFDIRKNQPDFAQMLDKRMRQAYVVATATEAYQKAYNYSDYEMSQLDPDDLADEIMSIVNNSLRQKAEDDGVDTEEFDYDDDWFDDDLVVENVEQQVANQQAQAQAAKADEKRYAGKMLSRSDLVAPTGINHALDNDIITVYKDIQGDFARDTRNFMIKGKSLYGAMDGKLYIESIDDAAKNPKTGKSDLDMLRDESEKEGSKVHGGEEISDEDIRAIGSYRVYDNFYRFLIAPDNWNGIANGRFEIQMAKRLSDK